MTMARRTIAALFAVGCIADAWSPREEEPGRHRPGKLTPGQNSTSSTRVPG